jgi:hypothetical protein
MRVCAVLTLSGDWKARQQLQIGFTAPPNI